MSLSQSTPLPIDTPRRKIQTRAYRVWYLLLSLVALAGSGWLVWFFLKETRGAAVPAATEVGRWYGLVGFVLFLFLGWYGFRRISYRTRSGSLEFWYRAHLLVGVVALALVGCHSASAFLGAEAAGYAGLDGMLRYTFRSTFLGVLQIGFWGVALTGVFGWAYQTALKSWMLRNEAEPAIRRELELRRDALRAEMRAALADEDPSKSIHQQTMASEGVDRVLGRLAVRRMVNLWPLRSWAYWERETERALDSALSSELPAEARPLVRELNRVEVLLGYSRLLRWWTIFHLLFTALAVQLMLWHIWVVATRPR